MSEEVSRERANQELTELAKVELEKTRIQAEVNQGWQKVITEVTDKFEKYSTQKGSRETRLTTTLTVSILVFLFIIIGALGILTYLGKVTGESLLFFLGTLTGSLIMLVSERVRSQDDK